MNKNNRLLIISLLLVASAFLLLSQNKNQSYLKINDSTIKVKVAKTVQEQTIGLGGELNLAENQGMLFVFPDQQVRNFWMKDMLFPIDIIWIQDNYIIAIEKNVPIPTGDQQNIPQYRSPQPVNYVLEVNAGFTDKTNIAIGNEVDFFLLD
ncbi:MAG: hypothetical protein CMI53_04875 [Parcubacteria group bacterium]|nr:hypothetical protein [Parcubacteria group bacterium]|tara:strand:- start:14200 stop:14652 length:453 start_codon:yes stop_codon:yes gene_type:complete